MPHPLSKAIGLHAGVPAVAGGALYALSSPETEATESMRHKWQRIQAGWGVGGGIAGALGGHALGKHFGAKSLRARALNTIIGGAGGALLGTEYAAPEHLKEEARIRIARSRFPGGINPTIGAPVAADPRDLAMDPNTMYSTQQWGLQ